MKKEYIITIVLGGFLVLAIFYWFAWRPSNIKKTCYREVLQDNSLLIISEGSAVENRFEACFYKYGL